MFFRLVPCFRRSKSARLLFALCLLFALNSPALAGNYGELMDNVKHADKPYDQYQVESTLPISQKMVMAQEKYKGGSFKVLARKGSIERYQCSRCHDGKVVKVNKATELTHGDVKIEHGLGKNSLSCVDCHHVKDKDFLVDKEGQKIDFDHSYQLCGQCHFMQKRDWTGGVHGKRVKNWSGQRVVYNCATCHDPHSPRFEKRFPATFSKQLDE